MTYPHNFVKLSFGGPMNGVEEQWTCSLNIGNPVEASEWQIYNTDDTLVNGLVTDLKAWFARETTGISGNAKMTWVKISLIGIDGKYVVISDDWALNRTIDFAAVSGGGTSGTYDGDPAPQNSVALTLDTLNVRGLAKTGRIYPPLSGCPGATGYDKYTDVRATSFSSLISSLNAKLATATPAPLDQIVVASNVREGKISYVQRIKVGKVIDTIRRRRNAMKETYIVKDILVYGEENDDYTLAA